MFEMLLTNLSSFFVREDIWFTIIKVLLTTVFSALLGLIGTLTGKIIANAKESKIRKYAKTCVEAAEQKFPNEGKKMGPEKMQYVMDQLAIKFPKIKENTYLYNIAEAAVFELNKEFKKEAAIKEFEDKYGEKPIAVLEKENNDNVVNEEKASIMEEIVEEEIQQEEIKEEPKVEFKKPEANSTRRKISSF